LTYKLQHSIRIVPILLILSILVSCSTKKNTFSRRVYHNLTAHYNAYWNGQESLKEGLREMPNNIQDNYTFILPVYNYGTKDEAMSITPQMERAIEKASIVIQRHSMYFNNKEYVKWIDDAYLMIGQAYFYKHEYNMAKRTFDYVIKQYSEDPIRFDAMVWLASTYVEMEDWDKAQSLLDLVQSKVDKEEVPREVERRLPLVYADFYIKQQNYNPPIDHLERGLELNNEKLLLTRLEFILGQIYQLNGDYDAATEYYTKVVKRNPPYEMSFNAKINLAQTYDATFGDKKLIIKKLEKMLKDEKNEDYLDQIYYALAEIALREEIDSIAIKNLKLSVSSSVSNNYQKSLSSLKLADLYYSYPHYKNAQAYYDTTMMFLPDDYPNYDDLQSKTEILNNLVFNLNIVQYEDSVQYLASLPENERKDIIDKIIDDYKEAEKKKKEEEAQQQQNMAYASQTYANRQNTNRLSGGKWYFYNSSTLSYGYNEFIKKWGDRKLEDLWRLRNKQTVAFDYGDDIALSDTASADTTEISTDPTNRETYLQYLPLTEEKMALSDSKISDAFYKLGYIYKEGLYDYPRSIESFSELIDRFPDNEHAVEAYYHLYKMYESEGNKELADQFSDLIILKFPDSDYAKIIIDPNYNLVLLEQKNRASLLYEETYQAYMNEQYMMVQIYGEEALGSYGEDKDLIPKFKFLIALAKGKTEGVDSLKVGLINLTSEYPSSEVTPLANNILNHLYQSTGESFIAGTDDPRQLTEEEVEISSPYNFEPDLTHFYILVLDASKINVNATKIRISDHNAKYNRLDNLTISSVLLDQSRQMITVSNFTNKDDALDYYNAVINSEYILTGIDEGDFAHFVVSSENYKIFYQQKNEEEYLRFFAKTYLNE